VSEKKKRRDNLYILLERRWCFNCLNYTTFVCSIVDCEQHGKSCPCRECLLRTVCEDGCEKYHKYLHRNCETRKIRARVRQK